MTVRSTAAHAEAGRPPHLVVEAVTKHFDDVAAVGGVDLRPRDGELVTILGPSGCGKTTLLRLIAGFEVPDGGEVRIDGRVVSSGKAGVVVPTERRNIGMVFQTYAIWPHMTVEQNVAYPLKLQRRPREQIRARVGEVLDLVDLGGLESRVPSQLSGGQQQRVALARALAAEPALLLLDEPLSNLDAKLRERMRLDLRRIQQELSITTVLVTHDQTEAIELSDRILVMSAGKVSQTGPPEALYRSPANRFVAGFLGAANVLPGHGVGARWRLPDGTELALGDPPPGDATVAVVRPEDIEVDPSGDQATVVTRMFSGATVTLALASGPLEIVAVVGPEHGDVTRGQRVGLTARRAHYLID